MARTCHVCAAGIRFARGVLKLSVVNVAYPFAPVTADPVGGAEQVVARLDEALNAAGHQSIVIAAAGSQVLGKLVELPPVDGRGDEFSRQRAQRDMRAAIDAVLDSENIDLMHFHGTDFDAYLPPYGPPALISLHLPLAWYSAVALRPTRPQTWLQPVSAQQAHSAPVNVPLLAPIENGVEVDAFPALRKRGYALILGRVCAEKGFVDAIEAAKLAGAPLLLAGTVFAWPEHRRYFREELQPRLDAQRRFIGAVGGRRKRRLLAAARCVLIPSRVEETSSLVAMEALAAGTPVIAYRSGALSDIVQHGVSGYLVDDVVQMARAIGHAERIDGRVCRRIARERFPLARTLAAYLALYARIATWTRARKVLQRR